MGILGVDEQLGFRVNETLGLIGKYVEHLGFKSEEDFLRIVGGKTILDAGSGQGGIAKQLAMRHSTARVISLSSRLSQSDYRKDEKASTWIAGIQNQTTELEEMESQKVHDSRAIAAFLQSIPLSNQSVDIILDCMTSYYIDFKRITDFQRIIREYRRIIRENGEVRLDIEEVRENHNLTWQENVFSRNGFDSERILKDGWISGFKLKVKK
jgi:ubiquinone/menaquinone biosynthesis C-methylase UbiE